MNDDLALIQTVDFFPPVVDDPTDFGRIAAANALSDVYAMGGKPILALNIVGFPVGLPKDILGNILKGGADKAVEAGVLIVGGHTVDDAEPKYGMAVTGIVKPGNQVSNAAAKPGDAARCRYRQFPQASTMPAPAADSRTQCAVSSCS